MFHMEGRAGTKAPGGTKFEVFKDSSQKKSLGLIRVNRTTI